MSGPSLFVIALVLAAAMLHATWNAIIKGSEELPELIDEACENSGKPCLPFHPIDNFADAYIDFYQTQVLN